MLSLLPEELQLACLHFLDLRGTLAAGCVERVWHGWCCKRLPLLWHAQCLQDWMVLQSVAWCPRVDWKRVYKAHARLETYIMSHDSHLVSQRVFHLVPQVPSHFSLQEVLFTAVLQNGRGTRVMTWMSPLSSLRSLDSMTDTWRRRPAGRNDVLTVFVTWKHHTVLLFRTPRYQDGFFCGAKQETHDGRLFEITPIIMSRDVRVHMLFECVFEDGSSLDLTHAQVERLIWSLLLEGIGV